MVDTNSLIVQWWPTMTPFEIILSCLIGAAMWAVIGFALMWVLL